MAEQDEPTQEELEEASCWEPSDRVPGDAATTAFRRRARLHQARWRAAQGLPIGSQPINPASGKPHRPVGSRLPIDVARATGATFLSAAARSAAEARTEQKEPHQTFDRQRLWADLLWSPTLAINLFASATDADVHRWWPDVPGALREVRFEHSPGRLDPAFLGNLSSFAAALVLDRDDGTQGVIGVRAIYADLVKREQPKPRNMARYREVAERSGAFTSIPDGRPSDLTEIWLDHLLALSMLQHPSGAWTWARLVLVHPADHAQAADAADRYQALLNPPGRQTFATAHLEDLVTTGAQRQRYLAG